MDKYGLLFEHIQQLRIRDVRLLFSYMRKLDNDQDATGVLFPAYGFTVGEFTTAYITNMPTRAKGAGAAGGGGASSGGGTGGRGPEENKQE